MSSDKAADTTPKKSWERRSLFFVLRALGVIFFLLYLAETVPSTIDWGKLAWVRGQALSSLPGRVDQALAYHHPEDVTRWIVARSVEDRPEIMRVLTPRAGEISSFTFMTFSAWAGIDHKVDDQVFWYYYALFRLRYDALRCGAPDGPEDMTGLMMLMPNHAVNAEIKNHPEKLPLALRRVLVFDAAHPAVNNPTDSCPIIGRVEHGDFLMMPSERWPEVYKTLRLVSNKSITRLEKAQQKKTGK